ncbi:hypothetical protein OJF2_78900 (plasmid) [Aquisphaera giovannonii]|uniref:Cytochrome C n=1 Tax=Aquisphaera giovannonii TaxID=406548 RepID=A0A5B9WH18_9BACT|nr:dual specificity protein phosphatase [Aquisphaera giovannonii]QEH39275.1 hypothetical protein OJF2_78900 [Aquisphaera giovannonii]
MTTRSTCAGRCVGSLLVGVMLAASAGGAPPERLELPGIENAFRLGPGLYSGGEPRGEEAFSALKALGVRTVISVDGAIPDVETARRFGIRYVHLPIGYDGVPRDQAVRIIKAARTLPGPAFVHCHHGKHRGPAAVAVCGLANEAWTREQALSWLEKAGTAPEYRGLYEAARGFAAPTAEELERAGTDFPERAKVPLLVDMMVRVDGRWDRLKAVQKAGFRAPAGHPDVDPSHEALQLAELFREAARLDEARHRGEGFVRELEAAGAHADSLSRALQGLADRPGDASRRAADSAFSAVSRDCTGCHVLHRDN